MSLILSVLILIAYLSISYQDFKTREVYLLTYLVLYFLVFTAVVTNPGSLNVDYLIINSCMLLASTCLLVAYYLVRYGQASLSRLKASVGWGDVLMLPAFVISFSPVNMIVVFNLSLLAALIYHLICGSRSSGVQTIPLAGIQALVLSIVLIADFMGFIKMQADFYPLF